jgi:hypothetical protein
MWIRVVGTGRKSKRKALCRLSTGKNRFLSSPTQNCIPFHVADFLLFLNKRKEAVMRW